jgi:hypothetical protein
MGVVTAPYQVVLNLVYGTAGWTEKYLTSDVSGTPGTVLTKATSIAYYRTAFMALGVQLVFARACATDSAKDGLSCDLPYPLTAHAKLLPSLTAPNDTDVCVLQRFETGAGQWNNRYYRGIPDLWVTNQILQDYDPWRPVPNGGPPVSPTGNASLLSIQQSFWSYLIQVCPHSTKIQPFKTTRQYNHTPFTRIIPRGVTSHKTGRPFGLYRGRHQSNQVGA